MKRVLNFFSIAVLVQQGADKVDPGKVAPREPGHHILGTPQTLRHRARRMACATQRRQRLTGVPIGPQVMDPLVDEQVATEQPPLLRFEETDVAGQPVSISRPSTR